MHAIINQGDGKYYISYVFGFYRNVTATDDYQRYLETFRNPYYVVWDEKRENLIKWLMMKPNVEPYLVQQALIVDNDQHNWIKNKEEEGCVDFLDKEIIDSILKNGFQDKALFEKCQNIDKEYKYEEFREIRSENDIEDFDWATGNFHDAYIEKEIMQDDGTLYLLFEGIWGCSVEVWFWGDVEYDTSSRGPYEGNQYWYSSTVILKDGFVYFVDEEDMTVDKINERYCYFKARNMKYRIIPNSLKREELQLND